MTTALALLIKNQIENSISVKFTRVQSLYFSVGETTALRSQSGCPG